jgi:hypothetical protein
MDGRNGFNRGGADDTPDPEENPCGAAQSSVRSQKFLVIIIGSWSS